MSNTVLTRVIPASMIPQVHYLHAVSDGDFVAFSQLLQYASDPVYAALLATVVIDERDSTHVLVADIRKLYNNEAFKLISGSIPDIKRVLLDRILNTECAYLALYKQVVNGGKCFTNMRQTVCCNQPQKDNFVIEEKITISSESLILMPSTSTHKEVSLSELVQSHISGVSLEANQNDCSKCSGPTFVISQPTQLPWSLTLTISPSNCKINYSLDTCVPIGPTYETNFLAYYRLVFVSTQTSINVRSVHGWTRYEPGRIAYSLSTTDISELLSFNTATIVLERIDA